MPRMTFDIIDTCNLRCPSCYHGIHGGTGAKMPLDTCATVIEHNIKYLNGKGLFPYNWGEPLLHKQLPEFLRLFSQFRDLKVTLSSNLSFPVSREKKEQILQTVDVFKVSASGIDQQVYSQYHVGGSIHNVLVNLEEFVALKKSMNSKTILMWVWGKTLHNLGQEGKIRAYCEQHGIQLNCTRYCVTDARDLHAIFTDQRVASEIYREIHESLEQAKRCIEESLTPCQCPLLQGDIVTDHQGYVMTCCATKIRIDAHITEVMSLDQLEALRLRNDFCRSCFEKGLSGYYAINPKRRR